MKVLIVKTSSMGDVIHTLPALTDAIRAIPNIQFDWVVEEGFAQIPTWHPAVGQVIPVALRRWKKNLSSRLNNREWQNFKNKLAQSHYHCVIDAQGLIKSGLLTRIPQGARHGYDRHSIKEPIASYCYQYKHAVSKEQHAVERIRQLFSKALGYDLPNQIGDYGIASHFLNVTETNKTEAPYLMFLHATTRDNKHWPEDHWRSLIEKMAPMTIKLPWGAPHEYERAQRLAAGFSHVEVLPKLSLAEVAEQLAHAQAIVSVDTGLSHLAAALNRPNLTLYGPTDPGLIGGYGKNQHYLMASSHQSKDMATLTPEEVQEQLLALLTKTTQGSEQ